MDQIFEKRGSKNKMMKEDEVKRQGRKKKEKKIVKTKSKKQTPGL
jgi:hypothetical protein